MTRRWLLDSGIASDFFNQREPVCTRVLEAVQRGDVVRQSLASCSPGLRTATLASVIYFKCVADCRASGYGHSTSPQQRCSVCSTPNSVAPAG